MQLLAGYNIGNGRYVTFLPHRQRILKPNSREFNLLQLQPDLLIIMCAHARVRSCIAPVLDMYCAYRICACACDVF